MAYTVDSQGRLQITSDRPAFTGSRPAHPVDFSRGRLIANWDGTPAGAFGDAWNAMAKEQNLRVRGITKQIAVGQQARFTGNYTIQGGKSLAISSRWVELDLEVRADPAMAKFFNRLDLLAGPREKKLFKQTLRKATRTSILPILRKEIPLGTRTKYKPRRLRATAQIYRVMDDRILLSVGREKTWRGPRGGRYGLWHASIVHARWHAFFPAAFKKGLKPFNKAVSDELYDLMKYLAGSNIRFKGLI